MNSRRRPWCAAACLLIVGGCAAPERPSALQQQLHQSAAAARTAFADGDLVRAQALYTYALEAARLSDDALALGNLTFNLAMVVAEQGEPTRALAVLAEAAAALRRAEQPGHDVTLLRARLQWRAGDAEAAQRTLAAFATDAAMGGDPPSLAATGEAALLRGELACARGDASAALIALTEAARAFGDDPRTPRQANVLALAATLATAEGEPRAAASLHDRGAQVLQQAREYRRMATALAGAGEAYRAAGALVEAADRFVRAAQSRLGAHDPERARPLLRLAQACAEQTANAELLARVRACAQMLGESADAAQR